MKKIIINLSNSANKFFKKHIDIYDKFINNLKSVYNNNNTNIDIKAMKNYNLMKKLLQLAIEVKSIKIFNKFSILLNIF